ncbi:MAG: ABC transporter ATP-binding protein [Saprospiraceae bacterium]|nr:ABC transporter ATP-binding protein [Saprospiraceae bacterium]
MLMKKILQLENLSIGYTQRKQHKIVAKDITVDLFGGELVCLLGPNGAGKSTLMRTISGAQKPLGGQVLLEGKVIHDLPARHLAKKLSLVLTERVQGGLLTAYEIVALGRYPHTTWTGKLTDKDHDIIQWSIEMAGANELAGRMLAELSDGERQKIMVARALAQEPEVMILDEVTAFLDLPRRVEIMQLLRKLAHQTGKAILLSTHDMDLALRSADRLWLLPKGGDLQVGAPEDLVLNGAFEHAFASEGVAFNRQSGAFQMYQSYQRTVQLSGKGEGMLWTKRALERDGITVSESANTIIEVQNDPDRWVLRNGNTSQQFETIYDLMSGIRREEVTL